MSKDPRIGDVTGYAPTIIESSAMQQLPKNHPLMVAWEEYKQTPEYANSKKWAERLEHIEGSLWAAFEWAWRAAAPVSGE